MKIGEIIDRIFGIYSSGIASDDIRLSPQLCYSKMLSVRSKLIVQSVNKKQRVSDWDFTHIPCVELIEVPTQLCPCLPTSGCTILRSKYKLPTPLSGLSSDLLRSVSTADFSHKIDYVTLNAYKSQRGNKYSSRKMNYFILEEYLYISTPKKIKVVSINGIFEDPISAEQYKGLCECDTCDSCIEYREIEFPIGMDQIDTLIELVVQELVIMYKQIPSDTLNNSVEDSPGK
jgi:hypothetical protein